VICYGFGILFFVAVAYTLTDKATLLSCWIVWQKTMYQWYDYPMISSKRSCINDTITPWYLAKDHVSMIRLPHDIWQKTMYQWYDYPMISSKRSCINDTITPWYLAKDHVSMIQLPHDIWQKTMYQSYDYPTIQYHHITCHLSSIYILPIGHTSHWKSSPYTNG
jgi:hypothetical protein